MYGFWRLCAAANIRMLALYLATGLIVFLQHMKRDNPDSLQGVELPRIMQGLPRMLNVHV